MTDHPPPEIEEAATKVRAWLESQKAGATPAPKELSAAERFAKRVAKDTPEVHPDWKRS
jgi:hypothetical protein